MWKVRLKEKLSCPVEGGKELAPLSTLGAGGRCEFFAEPSSLEDVSLIFKARAAENFPLYILGGASNVVFADGLTRGVVLSSRRLDSSRWRGDGDKIFLEAEAGYSLPRAVAASTRNGLTGLEFAVGIPGTLGGAIAGNAGVGDWSIGGLLEEVSSVESDGSVRTWRRERWGFGAEFDYSYRRFSLVSPDRFFVSCKLFFRREEPDEIERGLDYFRKLRQAQPKGGKSAGCTFKNPEGDSAGRLLDVCGCKGLRVGGAVVSDVHANFIINTGSATGADVFELMESCRDIVFRETGITLEPEIKFLGFSV